MKKSEAYEILSVTPPADRQHIEEAYWQLAHKYRENADDNLQANDRLLELNEAYFTLTSRERISFELVAAQAEADPWTLGWEAFVSWTRNLIRSTAARWPGRGAEIATLSVCLLTLAGVALWNGAGLLWTLPVLAVALTVIRAPWRRLR